MTTKGIRALRAQRALDAQRELLPSEPACRGCGRTDAQVVAAAGRWVLPDLCSRCVGPAEPVAPR